MGLYDYGSRWYDAALGRFIQPDSIIPDPYNPLSYDRYAYVNNNPTNYNDPTGHFAWVLAGALVGAGISYGVQVYNNYQNGYTGSDAWTSNISGEAIVGGALTGAGAVLLAPAAVALVGDAAVGTSLIFGSTGLYLAGNSCYQASAIMEANIVYGVPGNPLPIVKYNPSSASEVIDADYEAQANGKPSVLTYTNNKATQAQNGRGAMSGYPSRTGFDRHEYPYKSTYEGGKGASVRYVNPGDNRNHGVYLNKFYRDNGYRDGFKFYVDSGYYPWSSLPADYYNAFGYEVNNSNQGGGR